MCMGTGIEASWRANETRAAHTAPHRPTRGSDSDALINKMLHIELPSPNRIKRMTLLSAQKRRIDGTHSARNTCAHSAHFLAPERKVHFVQQFLTKLNYPVLRRGIISFFWRLISTAPLCVTLDRTCCEYSNQRNALRSVCRCISLNLCICLYLYLFVIRWNHVKCIISFHLFVKRRAQFSAAVSVCVRASQFGWQK